MKIKNTVIFNYNKYHNKSCKCSQNHLHDSRGEARYCDELELQRRAGEIQVFEIQKNIALIVNGKKICTHRVDFWVINKDGKEEIREYKGYATSVWDIKRKLFKALFPEIPYIVVKG